MQYSILQSIYKKDNPKFLDQALKSIAVQTLQPQRIVLIKDGTLSNELESVIKKWESILPLFVCGYEKNQGLAHALNYGLQFVETELVARMDSDDICYYSRFEKQVCQFELDSTLKVLGTGIEEFYKDSEGRIFTRERLYPKSTDKKSSKLYRGTPLAHPTVMMKTELLKNFGYSENTKCNEDIDLWLRLLESGVTFKTLQEPLLHFRITDGTFNRRSISKAFNEFSIYSKYLFKFNGVNPKSILLFIRLVTRFMPKGLNKKIYLSTKRQSLFAENLMNIKILKNYVFKKNDHIFEAVCEFEENGKKLIKAVQIDTKIENVIEIPIEEVELYKLKENLDISITPSLPIQNNSK